MKLSNIAKRMIIVILFIALICILMSIIFYRSLGFLPFFFGVLLGTATSIIKVLLLERTVNKALTVESNKVRNYVSIQHILRLTISGVALLVGATSKQISLWGVIAGILAYQLAVYLANFKSKKSKKSNMSKEFVKYGETKEFVESEEAKELEEFEEFKKFKKSKEFKEFEEFKKSKEAKENE